MKKILSIPIIILILFSGITINFATHYCAGSVAAVKVSLDGELATCGMERNGDNQSNEDLFRKHCCEDVTASYSLSCNYIPSYPVINELHQEVIFVTDVPADYTKYIDNLFLTSYETIRPPGTYCANRVDLQILCISRI